MKFQAFFAIMAAVVAAQVCFVPEDESGNHDQKLCVSADGVVSVEPLGDWTPSINSDVDAMWVIICGAMVFYMQVGFGMLEAGCISEKNVINILYKNVMDASIAAISFWLVGYGIAYGDLKNNTDNAFIGTMNFGLSNEEGDSFHSFFFQWAFAATAATIVAGSVAERCKIEAYFVYSIILTVVIYPVVAHWIWDTEGWLSSFNPDYTLFASTKTGPGGGNGMVDFAGCGVVHMVGGLAGMCAAIVIGPRQGRFEGKAYDAHNIILCGMGVLFLWFGWYGFNCGSTLAIAGGASKMAAKVATTTTIAAASGCLTAAVMGRAIWGSYDILFACNGILAGLVSITASAHCVEPGAACAIGVIGTIVYKAASVLFVKLKIDDPLDAAPLHGFAGAFGALCPGIFSSDALLAAATGNENDAFSSGLQFGTQLTGVLAVAAWTIVTCFILFKGIDMTIGMRVNAEVEDAGLDASEHGSVAFTHLKKKQEEGTDAEKAPVAV